MTEEEDKRNLIEANQNLDAFMKSLSDSERKVIEKYEELISTARRCWENYYHPEWGS